MNLLNALLVLIVIILLVVGGYYLYLWFIRKNAAKSVDSAEIQDNIRKKQVIDVREPAEFDAKHILGARNIPYSQFKMRYPEIRKDKPVYLYDDALHYASRAANILKKHGYSDIHILKGGFSQWLGKTKSNI